MARTTARTSSKRSTGASKTASKTGSSRRTASQKPESQLEEYFIHELKDIYGAEKQLTKAIPKMQKAATTRELKQALEDHLVVTEEQIARLEEVFELLEIRPQAKKCEGMEGITKEGETVIKETEAGSVTRDAAIIVAAQKVEHYEIACYGSLVVLARTMGKEDVAQLLAQTLAEEKETDQLLTEIAESHINEEAEEEEV